jgi:hypothetical protein
LNGGAAVGGLTVFNGGILTLNGLMQFYGDATVMSDGVITKQPKHTPVRDLPVVFSRAQLDLGWVGSSRPP